MESQYPPLEWSPWSLPTPPSTSLGKVLGECWGCADLRDVDLKLQDAGGPECSLSLHDIPATLG